MSSSKRTKAEFQALLCIDPKKKFANCARASVTDGRTLLGFLIDHDDHQCAALTPERALIGLYADRAAARRAIAAHHASVP
jgi:hypothetical protein